jgi:hypothetical protein
MPCLTASDAGLTLGREFDNEAGICHSFGRSHQESNSPSFFIGLPTRLLVDNRRSEIGRLQGPFNWDARRAVDQLRDIIG